MVSFSRHISLTITYVAPASCVSSNPILMLSNQHIFNTNEQMHECESAAEKQRKIDDADAKRAQDEAEAKHKTELAPASTLYAHAVHYFLS